MRLGTKGADNTEFRLIPSKTNTTFLNSQLLASASSAQWYHKTMAPFYHMYQSHDTAAHFPLELFKHIYQAADGESANLRLVNRYWEQQIRKHVFVAARLHRSIQ